MSPKRALPITAAWITASLFQVRVAAQAPDSIQAAIARAMEAAPPRISAHATIVDSTGRVLRQGTNGWTCSPTAGPGSTHPACNDSTWVRLLDAVAHQAPFRTGRLGISYMLAGDDYVNNADPFDTTPGPGEVWVQEGPHLMLVVPDTAMLRGIPDDPHNGGPYVMWRGTPYVHVMVPLPATGGR